MLEILEELYSSNRETLVRDTVSNTVDKNRLTGYYCCDTILVGVGGFFSDKEISVLKKFSDLAPIQRKINETELRFDSWQFCHRMRTTRHVCNELALGFSEKQ